MKTKTPTTSQERLARGFLIALRAEGVPDTPARFMAKQTIDLYAYNCGRNRRKRALDLFSASRARELADQFKEGAAL